MGNMRIGINALYVIPGQNGGTETYLMGIMRELLALSSGRHEFFVYCNSSAAPTLSAAFEGATMVPCAVSGASRIARVLYEQLWLPRLVKRDAIDVLHSPGFVLPLAATCRHVLTVHDFFHERYPAWLSPLKRAYWRLLIPPSIRKADRVIVVSEAVKTELERYFPDAMGKSVVTHEGSKFSDTTRGAPCAHISSHSATPYFFWVGTLAKHKNLGTMIRAFRLFKEAHGGAHRLVLAGGVGQNIKPALMDATEREDLARVEPWITWAGRVSDAELATLYQGALSLIFLSLYEGFGLPVLEAMSLGCPVITSARGSLGEVAGDAALLIDEPTDAAATCQAMSRIAFDIEVREKLITKGLARSEEFTFAKAAQLTLECYGGAA